MTPQEEIQVRQMIANQMSARQPMLRDQMPDMNPAPRMTRATPEAEQTEYRRQRTTLENAARFRGLLGNTPTPNSTTNYRSPYSREEIERLMRDEEAQRLGLRPPTDAERARLDVTNPEMPLNDLARARLEAERPFNPGPEYGSFPNPTPRPPSPPFPAPGTPLTPEERARAERERQERLAERVRSGGMTPEEYALAIRPNPETSLLNPEELARTRAMEVAIRDAAGTATTPYVPPLNPLYLGNIWQGGLKGGTPVGGEMAADPEPEEYDGFVDSGTGQRGFMGDKYMPTPMDTSVAMAQAAPVAMAQAAPPVANTAYNAPLVASTAYMPPPTAAPVNTAYMPPPTDAPVNTAYMPSRRTVPVDTTYRPPASANTTYMPSPSPSYGMSTTPTYNMSTSTTPTYGTSNGGQRREPSFSPNQAGKYKVDGPRLRNTGGLFNDLNAFFGRPQT